MPLSFENCGTIESMNSFCFFWVGGGGAQAGQVNKVKNEIRGVGDGVPRQGSRDDESWAASC